MLTAGAAGARSAATAVLMQAAGAAAAWCEAAEASGAVLLQELVFVHASLPLSASALLLLLPVRSLRLLQRCSCVPE